MLRDLLIRARLAATLMGLVARRGVRTVCVGELVASGWLLRLIRHMPIARTVAYVHGEEITTVEAYDRSGQRRRRALRAADAIVVVSRFTEQAVRDFLGPEFRGPINLIENGVDAERFRPGERSADLVRRHGLADSFTFVTVCRLLEKKGVDNAIRAFAAVCARHPSCRYVVVGSGPYAEALAAIARDCGIADRVVFTGAADAADLPDYYRLGDVFVMPNRTLANGDTEGFGLVFLEANACGLPVIAGRDGGSTAAVRDMDNGLVVDGNSVGAIAAAMLRLIGDSGLRNDLAARGLAAAHAADWRRKAMQFLSVCDALHAGSTAARARGPLRE
jgi:phosphatidylinositol alpha-1,6-mannosyltransferase